MTWKDASGHFHMTNDEFEAIKLDADVAMAEHIARTQVAVEKWKSDRPANNLCRTCFGRGSGSRLSRYTECMDCSGSGER